MQLAGNCIQLANCKAPCTKFLRSFAFQRCATQLLHFKGVPPSYLPIASLKNFVGGNAEFTTVKLDGVNYLIQIFLQTHHLQRIIFGIFCHQSSKMISNKAKKITKFPLLLNGSYNYPLIFHRQGQKAFEYQIYFPFLLKVLLKVLFK